MRSRKTVDWPYVIGLLLLPLVILSFFLLAGGLQGFLRYNPAYFSPEYRERYEVPNDVITDLEAALMEGDSNLISVLQGTHPGRNSVEANPNLRFMIMLESPEGEYFDYLFMDTSTYQRYPQHLKFLNGRYIRVPDGLYYWVNSHSWVTTFFPLAAIWWLIVLLFTLGVWFFRVMAAFRRKRFGDISPEDQ